MRTHAERKTPEPSLKMTSPNTSKEPPLMDSEITELPSRETEQRTAQEKVYTLYAF